MKEQKITMGLRVPATCKDWLQNQASENDRSMNYIIVKLIEDAMNNDLKRN